MKNSGPRLIEILRDQVKRLSRSKWAWLAIGSAAFVITFLLSLTSAYDQFEQKLYDIRFQVKPKISQWDKLVLLDIDDVSIVNAGEYPWPRNLYAKGLAVLTSINSHSGAFDIEFIDESPRFADRVLMKQLREKALKKKIITAEDLDNAVADNDVILSAAVKKEGKIALAYSFAKDPILEDDSPSTRMRKEAFKKFVKKASVPIPQGKEKIFQGCVDDTRKGIQFPITPLVEAGGVFGFVDSDKDTDGSQRKVRLVRVFDGRIYFEMGLSMVMDLCGVKKEDVEIVPGDHITLKGALNPVTYNKKDIVIPVDSQCQMYINWAGDYLGAFVHIPFYALLEYDKVKEAIGDRLDAWEGATDPKMTRTTLYGLRNTLNDQLKSEKDGKKRNDLIQQMDKTNREIYDIEGKYLEALKSEREKTAKQYEAAKDAKLKNSLADMDNDITATQIVHEVDRLRGKVYVVGLTATGTQDRGVIPYSSDYFNVGSYPNIVNTVLQEGFFKRSGKALDLIFIFVAALALSFMIYRQNAKMSLVLIAVSFVVYNLTNVLLFAFARIWIDQLGVNIAIFLPSITIIGIKFLSEESQKRFIKSAFSHYLSNQVIDDIIKNPEALQLGGEEREVTLFFSDIKGFTSISEQLTPSALVLLLNDYLSGMTDIVLDYKGYVDKFIGDAIMAFYGAPGNDPDHAQAACFAAIDMQKALKEMRTRWKKEGAAEIYSRFGINTGPAVIGNMGSRTRMNYTAMGDTVNLASRLEGANKYYGTYSMISEMTYAKVKNDVEVRYLDKIRVVGKELPITVYELVNRKGSLPHTQKELFEIYNSGIELFNKREWEKARNAFKSALKVVKDDGPSKTYIERCAEFIEKPPSKKWDGVYKLSAK
jgi:adenylate cyclase